MNKYKKWGIAAIGAVLILIGAADWVFGALMRHDRVIIFLGAILVAVAGFIHGWQREQEKSQLPFLGLAVSPLEQAFDPTKPASILQWNSNAVSGLDAWIIVLIFVTIGVVYWIILKPYFQKGRCRKGGPQKARGR